MNVWVISGIILAAGLIICLLLFIRGKWLVSRKNIQDYEDGRNKLTFRKKKEEPVEEESSFGFPSLGSIVSGFIVLLVGLTLLPEVSNQLKLASNASNVTSSMSSTLIGIVLIFFAIAIAASAIAIVANSLRNSGMI